MTNVWPTGGFGGAALGRAGVSDSAVGAAQADGGGASLLQLLARVAPPAAGRPPEVLIAISNYNLIVGGQLNAWLEARARGPVAFWGVPMCTSAQLPLARRTAVCRLSARLEARARGPGALQGARPAQLPRRTAGCRLGAWREARARGSRARPACAQHQLPTARSSPPTQGACPCPRRWGADASVQAPHRPGPCLLAPWRWQPRAASAPRGLSPPAAPSARNAPRRGPCSACLRRARAPEARAHAQTRGRPRSCRAAARNSHRGPRSRGSPTWPRARAHVRARRRSRARA